MGAEDAPTLPSHYGTAFRWMESCLFASVGEVLCVVWCSVEHEGDGRTPTPFARVGIGGGRGRGIKGRGRGARMLLSDVPLPLLLSLQCERCFFSREGVPVTLATNACERWICAPPESATVCPTDDGGGMWCSSSVEVPRPSLKPPARSAPSAYPRIKGDLWYRVVFSDTT